MCVRCSGSLRPCASFLSSSRHYRNERHYRSPRKHARSKCRCLRKSVGSRESLSKARSTLERKRAQNWRPREQSLQHPDDPKVLLDDQLVQTESIGSCENVVRTLGERCPARILKVHSAVICRRWPCIQIGRRQGAFARRPDRLAQTERIETIVSGVKFSRPKASSASMTSPTIRECARNRRGLAWRKRISRLPSWMVRLGPTVLNSSLAGTCWESPNALSASAPLGMTGMPMLRSTEAAMSSLRGGKGPSWRSILRPAKETPADPLNLAGTNHAGDHLIDQSPGRFWRGIHDVPRRKHRRFEGSDCLPDPVGMRRGVFHCQKIYHFF